MLGDQPGVDAATVATLLAGRGDAPLAVCRYDDGRGHPIAFGRDVFAELAGLHGDKGVWRLLDRRADDVVEVAVPGPIPRDVDTQEDYRAVLDALAARMSPGPDPGEAAARSGGLSPTSRRSPGAWPRSTTWSTRPSRPRSS